MKRIHYDLAKQKALKKEDAWSEVLIVDPITLPISYWLATHLSIHPLHVTFLAFFTRICAAFFFLNGLLAYGALFAYLGILLDGMDGKIARILQKSITLHGVSDFLLDQLASAIMCLSLFIYSISLYEYWLSTLLFFWLAALFIIQASTSTLWRLRVEINKKYSPNETEKVIWDSLNHINDRTVIGKFKALLTPWIRIYFNIRRKLRSNTLTQLLRFTKNKEILD